MKASPSEQFNYVEADPLLGAASALPYVPVVLIILLVHHLAGHREVQNDGRAK